MNRLAKFCAVFALSCSAALAASPDDGVVNFSVTARIAGADGGWDFLSIDPMARRLYVARSNGVMVVDLETGKVADKLVEGSGVHGVMPLPGTPLVISTNGRSNNAVLFDGATGKVETTFATGQNPDALVYEPKTGLAVIFNGRSKDATLFDLKTRSVVGTIALQGKPEVGVVDGTGKVYLNIEDTAEIAVLDIEARKLIGSYKLPGCDSPTGLALDASLGLLVSACNNKIAKLVDVKTGNDMGQVAIGNGPDGVLLDDKRRLAFIPAGDGTLTVVAMRAANDVAVLGTIETQKGARTGALDPETGKIYLPTAKYAAPETAEARPKPIPGTFEILVVSGKL